MKFPVCDKCNLYKTCDKPFARNTTGFINPSLIIIGDIPADDKGNLLSEDAKRLIESALGVPDAFDVVYYYTTLLKCYPHADPVTKDRGYRVPSKEETDHCKNILLKELMAHDESVPIVTLGNTVLESLVEDVKGITTEIGIGKKLKVFNKTFNLIPNYSPIAVLKNPNLMTRFKQTFVKALNFDGDNTDIKDRIKILNPDESVAYLKNLLELVKSGKIDYSIFDIETNNFSPHKGKSIMYSFAHEADSIGVSIPLSVNNEFHKENTLAALNVRPPQELAKRREEIYAKIEAGGHDGADIEEARPELESLNKQIEDHLEEQFQRIKDRYTIPFTVSPAQAAKIQQLVLEVLYNAAIVGHNLKFDLGFLLIELLLDIYRVKIKNDTLISGHQLDGLRSGLKLKERARRQFNVTDDWEHIAEGYLSKFHAVADRHFGNIPTGLLGEYSALDAYWNLRVHQSDQERIVPGTEHILEEIVRASIPFAEAEQKGTEIDIEMYDFIRNAFGTAIAQYKAEMRELPVVQKLVKVKIEEFKAHNASPRTRKKMSEQEMLDQSFSPTSHNEVRNIIYGKDNFGLPISENFMTDGGKKQIKQPQTTAEALDWLKTQCPADSDAFKFITSLSKHNEISTLYSRLNGLPNNMIGNSYKPEFFLPGTVTGRLSSGWHSIPSKSDFKRVCTSRWRDIGGLFLAPDASQLELRIIASVAKEETMIDAYAGDIDLHVDTGAMVATYRLGRKVPIEEVTSEQRGAGKTINFGIAYGKTAYSMAPELGITSEEAEALLSYFFDGRPKLRDWIAQQHRDVLKNGYVLTPMGRIIPVPDAFSRDKKLVHHAKNCGVNYPIQSSASDIIEITNNHLMFGLRDDHYKTLFLSTVHDSLEYDVYPGELFQVMKRLIYLYEVKMPQIYPWITCPLRMDIVLGTSWGGGIEFKVKELDDDHCVLSGSALRKDFLNLQHFGQKAYNIELDILEKKETKNFPIDIVYRDKEKWTCDVKIWKK